jgi:cystathionine beta-lyase/cystathionine gamma-synthase
MKNLKNVTWGPNTKLNHPPSVELPPGNEPLLNPIYHSSKFSLGKEAPYWDQYVYSRISNPTVDQLQKTLAEAMNREECIVFGSGIAAITNTFLSLLKSGDHIIGFRESYRPTRVFIRDTLPSFGISSTILKLNDFSSLRKAIQPGITKIIHFESPTNPNLQLADIQEIIKIAKDNNILVSMDGTFAGIHQHNHFDLDLTIHSLTKYANGHGDVIAGAVACKKELMVEIKKISNLLGAALDPQAANLVLRGLKTYHLRFNKQCESAKVVADFLNQHPKVNRTYYPGLESCQQLSLVNRQMKDSGAIISFELKEGDLKATDFCHQLKLISFAVSLGSTESIICPTLKFFGEDLSLEDRSEMGINDFSIRLSIGIEDVNDIINDLKQVLELI